MVASNGLHVGLRNHRLELLALMAPLTVSLVIILCWANGLDMDYVSPL